jgi:cathepsin L
MLGSYYAKNPQTSKSSKVILLSGLLVLGIIGSVAYLYKSPSSRLISLYEAEEREFQTFVVTYNKNYDSEEEYFTRLRVFLDNLAYIRVYNSMDQNLVLGVGPFADLTTEEFRSRFFPRPTESTAGPFEDFAGLTAPSQVDWRTKGAVTPVKNQGQCGSCWSFSATGGMEGAWFLAGHTLVSLSEQQLMDCSGAFGNNGCNGGFYRQAYSYVIANKGVTSESNYPYTAKDGTCNKTKAVQFAAVITSKVNVAGDNPTALQNAVAQQPTSVSVEADQPVWQHYTSGTISANCGTNLDHDVLAVGYDTTASPPYWIVKNSWGTSWGLAGYLQIEISSGKGVCGINMTPGYPVA